MSNEKIISAYSIPGVGQEAGRQDRLTKEVCKNTCDDYNTKLETLFTKDRHKEISEPRQMIMYLLSVHNLGTLKSIGKIFKRDHTTVINARERIRGFIDVYPLIKARIKRIEEKSGL